VPWLSAAVFLAVLVLAAGPLARYMQAVFEGRLAGCLVARPTNELANAGTFRTDNALFVALLIGVILLVGAITFLPADLLGPIVEHFELQRGATY
jgi:potassium-transporting ATPase potassium-binding subunit